MSIAQSHLLSTRKIVLLTLCGIAFFCIGIPLYSLAKPFLFSGARAKRGTYSDVVEIKEISRLSVHRLLFSKVVKRSSPKGEEDLDKCDIYLRRIMRGHVTTSLDFSRIDTNKLSGKVVFIMPPLEQEAIIDEWVYYDSKGTGDEKAPKNFAEGMDAEFRKTILGEALHPNRVDSAKKQAERVVKLFYPDEEVSFCWPTNLVVQKDAK